MAKGREMSGRVIPARGEGGRAGKEDLVRMLGLSEGVGSETIS